MSRYPHSVYCSCIPLLTEHAFSFDFGLLSLPGVNCLPSPESLWETLGMGEECDPMPNIFIPSPPPFLPPFLHRKTSLNKFKSSPIKTLIPFPSKTNFHVTILTSFICKLQSFLLYQFFNFSLCTTTSASTSQMHSIEKFPEQKFPFFPSFNAIWKTPFLLMLVLISFPLLLLFQASISHGPTPVVILWLVG